MTRLAALPLLALAFACTPQTAATGPEAVVRAIYQTLEASKGEKTTPQSAIPMTAELDALVKQAEAVAGDDGPVFDGDLAGNCQDCTDFSDLRIEVATSAAQKGRAIVNADFKLFRSEQKHVQWDLIETAEGWRVDNIVSDGFDVRAIAKDIIATPPLPDTDGDRAVECLAYLGLHGDALKKATPPGDTTAIDKAAGAWRKTAETFFKPDELAQYFASSIDVLDDLKPQELKAKADECAMKAPA